MNNQIDIFITYLLDTETTSEIAFIENISKHNELFQSRFIKDWEVTVLRKLQQVHRNTIISTLSNVDDGQKSESRTSDEESTASSSSEDEHEEEQKSVLNGQNHQSPKTTEIYFDIVRQCQRLLRLLYHCQQNYPHFTELYFHTLEQCIKSDNEKMIAIVLQQIALHLFEGTHNDNERQRLIKHLPSDSSSHQPTLTLIQTLVSTNQTEINTTSFLSNHIDILYPYKTRFLDVRREFRDTTHYFIDGDSFLISIAHHANVNLNSYYGNTLHIIYIIERILVSLFQQSNQCNYTLVFFDCHYNLYSHENSILSLLRTCLIAHLSKNAHQPGTTKIQQFSSWFDNKYLEFIREEKPLFIFYHDMSSFDTENDNLLSKDVLEKLLCMYRLFGNYHQYVIQCQLYLMNKLILTETSVKCFQIQFYRMCPKNLLEKIIKIVPDDLTTNGTEEQDWSEKMGEDDVRLFMYLKTMKSFNKERDLIDLLNPLLVLHVALLIRLSLSDRHLPSSIPSITFSGRFSQLMAQFQHSLSAYLSSSASVLSWSKVGDMFDGRLFAFTLYQIYQSPSSIRLDSKTLEIVKQSFDLLNIPFNENIFENVVKSLIQSNDIVFSFPPTEKQLISNNTEQTRPKVIKLTNPFIDTYLQPILSSRNQLTFDLVNPDEIRLTQNERQHQWQAFKEVGDEISRIKDNAADPKKQVNHRFRTKNLQKLYDYFDLYGRSLTTRDARDSQLQIILPTASTPAPTNDENLTDRPDSACASGGKKKQQHKSQPKKVQQTKAEKIIEGNKLRILDKRIIDETDKMTNVDNRLKQIPVDNHAEAIDLIDESLSNFETPTKRLELLKRKFDVQRKYLRTLKKRKL